MRVGVGQIHFSTMQQLRRAHRHFPAVEARVINRERKEDVGIADVVVVEIIMRALMVVIHVERPTTQRNSQAELMFLIALTAQRDKAQTLLHGISQQRAARG